MAETLYISYISSHTSITVEFQIMARNRPSGFGQIWSWFRGYHQFSRGL